MPRYRIAIGTDTIIAERLDGSARLHFPYRWEGGSRAYIYASVTGAQPLVERDGQTTRMDLATFQRWMKALELADAAAVVEVED